MPYYQNTAADTTKLIIGNCKIETSATAGGTYVNLGHGIVSGFKHNVEVYTVQSGNGPDPIEGISKETATIDFQMIEYDASVLSAIQCGIISADTSTSSTQTVINGGGNSTITPRAFKITNTRMIGGVTKQTVLVVYKANMVTGLEIQFKSDNDADPVGVIPGQIMAELDTSLSAGSQLFKITRDLTTA
jgi:hypothetical protein